MRAIVHGELEQHERVEKKNQWRATFVGAFISAIATTCVAVASVLVFLDNRVEAQTVKASKTHEDRLTTLEHQRRVDREETAIRFERLERSNGRQEEKLDALLDKLRVPNPAPRPADGGPP